MKKYGFENLRKYSQAIRNDISKVFDNNSNIVQAFDEFDSYFVELSNQPISLKRNISMILACKLLNHIYSGIILAENGLIVDSILCGRNALETVAFYWLTHVDEDAIHEYANNKVPRPVDVRKRLEKRNIDINLIRDIYALDSQVTHVSRDGERFHTKWENVSKGELFIGGAFLPKDQEEMFKYLSALLFLFQSTPPSK